MSDTEFLSIPVDKIIVQTQVRSTIDVETESFKSLEASIAKYGIMEPLIVSKDATEETYLLICGERRLLAAKNVGLSTVPAVIMNEITQKSEVQALQLTENLQREDLNPIDLAKGIVDYMCARHADRGYGLEGVLGGLVQYNRRPEDVPDTIATTVVAISQITGKSITALHRTVSLLKLEGQIQEALRQGNLPVSQGYIFAAHRDNPNRMKIFESIMATPVTNAVLEKMLTIIPKTTIGTTPAINLSRQHRSMTMMQTTITKNTGKYTKDDLQKLVDELQAVLDLVKGQMEGAGSE